MTIQTEEKIKIDGNQYDLLSRPFEPFLKAMHIKLIPMSSACLRGYIGTWEIINNFLYLTRIKISYNEEDEEKLMPLKLEGVIYQATWYTGDLVVAMVEPTYYHPGCLPVYTEERHFSIERGQIVNDRIVYNPIPEVEDDGLPF